MKQKTENTKGFTLVELLIVIVIVTIMAFNAIMAYGKFVKEAMISEGKMLASSVAKVEKLHYAEFGNYQPIFNASYTEVPEIDSRQNKYFKNFSVYVPGNYENAIFTVVTTSETNILAGIDVILHSFTDKSNILVVTNSNLSGDTSVVSSDDNTQNDDNDNKNNGNNGKGNDNDGDDNNHGGGQEKNGNNGKN